MMIFWVNFDFEIKKRDRGGRPEGEEKRGKKESKRDKQREYIFDFFSKAFFIEQFENDFFLKKVKNYISIFSKFKPL